MNTNNLNWGEVKLNAQKLSDLMNTLPKKVTNNEIVDILRERDILSVNYSNYGVIKNVLLPGIIDKSITPENWKKTLRNASKNSKITLYEVFPDIINVIEGFLHQLKIEKKDKPNEKYDSISKNWKTGIITSIDKSKSFLIQRQYLGLYYCYTHSTYDSKLLKYPLLIRENPYDKSLEVFLGNKNSNYQYKGVPVLVGSDTLCISLIDFYDNITELMQITLRIPYTIKPPILRGSFSTIESTRQPIGGRVVLCRISDVISLENFEIEESDNVDYDDNAINFNIRNYLKDEIQSLLRFPSIDSKDHFMGLMEEKFAIEKKFSTFDGFHSFSKSFDTWNFDNHLSSSEIEGVWLSLLGKDTIILFAISQSNSKITFSFQHYKKNIKDGCLKGQGTGIYKNRIASLSYQISDKNLFRAGSIFLKLHDAGLMEQKFKTLSGVISETDTDEIKFLPPDNIKLEKILASWETAIRLLKNEKCLFKSFDEVKNFADKKLNFLEQRSLRLQLSMEAFAHGIWKSSEILTQIDLGNNEELPSKS